MAPSAETHFLRITLAKTVKLGPTDEREAIQVKWLG
jgi:hypothetical protein